MPRTARLIVPDLSVHIVQRGHDGSDCFFDDADYHAYVDLLREFVPRCACSLHAYCLMDAAPSTPEQLAELVRQDQAKWAKVIKAANIKLE